MTLFLALSCLQGRPMGLAARELLDTGVQALQLTPGNAPTVEFVNELAQLGVETATHHGFAESALRQPVWDGTDLLVTQDSVHPPRTGDALSDDFFAKHEAGHFGETAFEVMYPGYVLGSGHEVERAMDDKMRLAVDVSHVFIQRSQSSMARSTWLRLQDYEGIYEVHLSANDGKTDQHRPITASSFGLDWAVERARSGSRLVLESYFHRATLAERQAQVGLVTDRL